MADKKKKSPSQQRVDKARQNTGAENADGSDNRIQEAYDDIHNRQGGSQEQDDKSLYERETNPDQDETKPLDSSEQAQTDNKTGGDGSSGLYSQRGGSSSSKPLKSQIKGAFSGKKKYGWIGGGIAGLVIGGLITLFPVLGPVHIFNNLFDHNFGFNDSFRRNRTTRIVRSVLNINRTNRNLSDTPFKLKADLVDFEKFETRMQSKGWSFEYNADGEATGLIKPDGTRANFDDPDVKARAEINELVKDTVPAWRMNKRVRTRSLVTTFTGPRRSFSWTNLFRRNKTAEPDFEVARFKKEAGIDRINVNDDLRITDGDGDTVTDRALQETVDAKLDGATDARAIDAGVAEAKRTATPDGGRTSLIVGTTVVGCIAYSVYENELQSSYERYTSALRYASTFMLGVNEVQQGGDVDIGEVGQFFGEYNRGEPRIVEAPDIEEVYDEEDDDYKVVETEDTIDIEYDNTVGTFAESAAWQRATGADVTGPELQEQYRVYPTESTLDMLSGIFLGTLGVIGSISANIPGFGLICDAINSTFGFIVGITLDLLEGLLAIAACATGAGCVALAKFAIVEGLYEAASYIISAAATGFAGFLTDNPVQSAAILDQGLNLTSSEENRTATPIDSKEYNSQVAAFKSKRNLNSSFAERYFDMGNPSSLATHLATAKMSFSTNNLNPSSLIASLFNMPGSSLVALFNSGNVYAQADLEFDNYGFQKYSFDNGYKEVDPFDNAEEVTAMIDADTEVASSADEVDVSGNLDRDFATLCMGYDPNSGLVDKSVTSNILPVFSDPQALGAAEAERRNNLYDALCIEAASSPEQIDNYSQIGRFVDDIELISSMIELTGEEVPPLNREAPTGGGGGGGSTDPAPDPDPTPPPVCDPNDPSGGPCLE